MAGIVSPEPCQRPIGDPRNLSETDRSSSRFLGALGDPKGTNQGYSYSYSFSAPTLLLLLLLLCSYNITYATPTPTPSLLLPWLSTKLSIRLSIREARAPSGSSLGSLVIHQAIQKQGQGGPGNCKRARGNTPSCVEVPWSSWPSFLLFPGFPGYPSSYPEGKP